MTEQEAIATLLNEITDGEISQEPTAGEEAQTNAQPSEQAQQVVSAQQERQSQDTAKQTQDEQEVSKEPQAPQEVQNVITAETLKKLNELGIDLSALAQAVAHLSAKQEAQDEQARQKEVFEKNINRLRSEFPTIKPDDLGKWAQQNELEGLISDDYSGWRAVAMAMLNTATPQQSPDNTIGTNKNGNELGAFEKLKKGEDVSDVELGASLLKQAGLI
ncbi:MAG: hypothetical protein LUC34_01255 [Campylobacter sp.]|nr:hypothetical protein [Campylobacter sp.]